MLAEPVRPISRKSLKPKATAAQVGPILSLHKQGKTNKQIADQLLINGQSVNGVIASAKRQGMLPPGPAPSKGTVATAFPQPPGGGEKQLLEDLKKAWKKSKPDSESSLYAVDGQKFYIASYPGKGLVLKLGDKAKPAFLPWMFASRLGFKLTQFAQEARMPRVT